MNILQHKFCNEVIGGPSDMTADECSSLPICRYEDQHGVWSMSFWKPTEEEIAAIVKGNSVVLSVRASGRQHPVVGLGVLLKED